MQAQLISDLTDVSRLNLGKVSLAFEPLDPGQIVRDVVNAMRPTIDTSAIGLEVDIQPNLPWIQGDRHRVQQIVSNLISNAVKFSSSGSTVRVRGESVSAGVVLEVADEGQGIDPDFLPFIFDRFAQGDGVRNRRQTGLGLGLAIVKQLVEAHGGTVSATSAGLGKGATFTVRLPIEAVSPAISSADDGGSQAVEGVLDGLRLLVVEDDPEANAMLNLVLTEQGAVVTSAYDFDGGLAAIRKARPDLLVCDIGLPGKDGYELMRAIRKSEEGGAERLPAIALTSFTRDRDLEQERAAGFDAHCSKPLRPLELFQQIQVLLHRPRFQSTR